MVGPRYADLSPIGSGGMSEVYRAFDRARGQHVALKVVHADWAPSVLSSEFRFIAELNHPGIVAVHDYGLTAQGRPYFTMELVLGGTLLDFSAEAPLRPSIDALRTAFQSLDFVHARGVVHGDLKPANILMGTTPGGETIPKLLDFGIACTVDDQDGAIHGTACYMAPEIPLTRQRDRLTDLYAMGVVLYEILTDEVPFFAPDAIDIVQQHLRLPPPDPRDIAEGVPDELAEIALRLLEKAPAKRFQNARAVAVALGSWLRQQPHPSLDPGRGGSPRSRWIVAAPRVRLAGEPRLVGRGAELDRLFEAAVGAQQAPAELFVISGNAGAGKSRLLKELHVMAELEGTNSLSVSLRDCRSSREPFERLARTLAGALGDDSLLDLELSQLGEAAGVEQLSGLWGSDQTPLAERLITVAERLADVCAELAFAGRTVLSVDDLESVAEEAEPALLAFVRRARRAPLVLIVAGRTDPAGTPRLLRELCALSGAEHLALAPLDEGAIGDIVLSLLGEKVGDRQIVEKVCTESGGNPRDAERIVRALVASDAIVMQRGAWLVAEELEGALPSLSAETGARQVARGMLAPLTTPQRRVGELLACLGPRVPASLLLQVGPPDLSADDVERSLVDLVDAGVLERDAAALDESPVAAVYRFARDENREVLVEAVPHDEAVAISRRTVEVLGARHAERTLFEQELISHHLHQCGRYEEAAQAAAEAIREATRVGGTSEVAALLGEMLGPSPDRSLLPAALWCALGSTLADSVRRRGDVSGAITWYQRVVDAASLVGDASAATVATALRKLGELLVERGETAAGFDTLRRALGRARALGDADLVGRASFTLASALLGADRAQEAARFATETLDVAPRSTDWALRARTLRLRASIYSRLEAFEQAEADATAAAREYDAFGSPRGAAAALAALGTALQARGHHDRATQIYRDALDHARAARWLGGITQLEIRLGRVAHDAGDWDAAHDHFRAAVQGAEQTRDAAGAVEALDYLGQLALWRGDTVRAEQVLGQALDAARAAALCSHEAAVLRSLASLHGVRGLGDEVVAALDAAIEAAQQGDDEGQRLLGERARLDHDVRRVEPATEAAESLASAAQTLLEQAIRSPQLNRERPLFRCTVAEAVARATMEPAAASSARTTESGPASGEVEHHLAMAVAELEGNGCRVEAARAIRRAAELATERLVSRLGVAARLGEAIELFRRLRAAPDLERALGVQLDIPLSLPVPPSLPAPSHPQGESELLGLLIELTRHMGSTLDLDELLERIVDCAIRLMQTDRGFVILYDHDEKPTFRVSRDVHQRSIDEQEIRVSQSILSRVAASQRPVVVHDAAAPSTRFFGESVMQMVAQSIACVPLMRGTKLVGVLYLDSVRPSVDWTPKRLHTLDALAAHAAVVMESARALEEQRRKSVLLSAVTRELLFPLDALTGHTARLAELTDPMSDGADHVQALQQHLGTLSGVVDRLMSIGRTDAERIAWSLTQLTVDELVHTAVAQTRVLCSVRGVQLDVMVNRRLPALLGNRERLVQVVSTVLTHAVQKVGEGGIVTVRASAMRTSRGAELGLPDSSEQLRQGHEEATGPGHQSEDLAVGRAQDRSALDTEHPVRLDVIAVHAPATVDEGSPAHRPRSRAATPELGTIAGASLLPPAMPDGTAPSLALAREIIRRHGGRMWSEEAPSGDTCFSLLLPTLAERRQGGAEAS